MTEPFEAVIIGAGIAGLCLAQSLKKNGIKVPLYERAPEQSHLGKGFWIEINSDGMAALQECLAPDHFARLCSATRPTNRHDCRWLTRAGLQNCLMEGLENTIQFGKEFDRYEDRPAGPVEICFKDSTRTVANALVGADGVHSMVRRQMLPHAKRIDTGVFAVGGIAKLTPAVEGLLPRNASAYPVAIGGPANQQMFFAVWRASGSSTTPGGNIHPVSATDDDTADHLMWRFSTLSKAYGLGPVPEKASPKELKAAVLGIIGHWDANLRQLVELIEPTTIFPLPIRTCVPAASWVTTRVTLMGDAIHGMVPHGGLGANIAMCDADLLGKFIAQAKRHRTPLVDALHEYELQMTGYGFRAVRKSLAILERVNGMAPILALDDKDL